MRHLLTLIDMTADEIEQVFTLVQRLKEAYAQGIREQLFPGRVVGLLFEKPSLRTRVSFETAAAHLGSSSIFLSEDVGWGKRESTADFSRVLSQYVDVLVCRARDHKSVEELAQFSTCPVINGLTDLAHPCQALSDVYTLRELHGSLSGEKLAFVGDGNNVARSLAVACAHLGIHFCAASPPGYELDSEFVQRLRSQVGRCQLTLTHEPTEAVRDAVAVYTDVWASMGQESERRKRRVDFAEYQVNRRLMSQAPPHAYFLHCLPAHRGDEVSDEVIDGPNSVVVQQATNRMHVQKGILAWLLGQEDRRTNRSST